MDVNQVINFDDMPKGSIELKITLRESRDFRVRMWMMRKLTRMYFRAMSLLSRGVTAGVLEV